MIRGSDTLEAVLSGGHTRVVRASAYQGNARLGSVDVSAASMTVDSGQFSRRSASVTMAATDDAIGWFTQPSTCLMLECGALFAGAPQYLPVHWGVSQTPVIDEQAGTITLTSPDLAQRITQARFKSPRPSTVGMTVPQQIEQLVREAIPWVGFDDETGDSTAVSAVTWDTDRAGAITSLAQSIGAETFLRPDGVWVIRYLRSLQTAAEYAVRDGVNLVSLARTLNFDKANNVIVARTQRADGTTLQGISSDTDPTSPLWVGSCGENVGFLDSSLYTTVSQCQAAAYAARIRLSGYPVSIAFSSTLHPGVEAGDRIDVIHNRTMYQVIPDSLTFDLTGASASFTARSATRPIPVVS